MGVFDFVKGGVQQMMIARPDNLKNLIVFKHPDQNFPMYSQLTVDSDECAVFFKDGRAVGVIPPGRHTMHTSNIPFLGQLVNSFTGGNMWISEIFFVKTTPVREVKFGGAMGTMRDPQLKCLVTPRINGEMSLVVTDPQAFIVGYAGQAATAHDNETILQWIRTSFMNGVKQTIGEFCIRQKITLLEVSAYQQELCNQFIAHAPETDRIGVRILQLATFNLNFSEDDEKKLNEANERFVMSVADAEVEVQKEQIRVGAAAAKAQQKQFELDQKFSQDQRYVQQLAGNYQNYAAGQAMMGAGQGMAEHGVGGGVAGMGAQMAVGVQMGNAMAGSFQQQPQFNPNQPAPPSFPQAQGGGGGMVNCAKCNARQPGGKFCAECGNPLAAMKKFCTGCGGELAAAAKFCANCGTPSTAIGPAAPAAPQPQGG